MSHHHTREDKTCLNCGNIVEDRFCGHCGQENIETRMSFLGLFAHFAEDLTHYEGKFWKTIKYLFFKPAFLTKEYLSGKRTSYLPPVRLYIFVSFFTFLLPHLLPENTEKEIKKSDRPNYLAEVDSIKKATNNEMSYISDYGLILSSQYKDYDQLDSARAVLEGTEDEMIWLEYIGHKKGIDLANYTPDTVWDMFLSAFGKNFPKSLFIYLPLFALVIQLFHRKQNYIYFDHAIFTLHFFSFLLLSLCLNTILGNIVGWFSGGHDTNNYYQIRIYLIGAIGIWTILHFLRAHFNMYQESTGKSISKAIGIILVNSILFAIIFLGALLITLMNLH
ncbi:MAG: DUF3667 domain-containing protein [Bacteroidia bacterium]